MQLAAPNAANAMPTKVSGAADVVSPSRLFGIASDRFRTASATLRIGGPGAAPTATVASFAIGEVEAGIRTLQSTLVPSTPFGQRSAAIGSIEQAQRAASLLGTYRDAVAHLGSDGLRRGEVPVGTLLMLDEATHRLVSALARLAVERP